MLLLWHKQPCDAHSYWRHVANQEQIIASGTIVATVRHSHAYIDQQTSDIGAWSGRYLTEISYNLTQALSVCPNVTST